MPVSDWRERLVCSNRQPARRDGGDRRAAVTRQKKVKPRGIRVMREETGCRSTWFCPESHHFAAYLVQLKWLVSGPWPRRIKLTRRRGVADHPALKEREVLPPRFKSRNV